MELRDRNGKPITKGVKVRSDGKEGVVRHVEPDYGVLTVVIEERPGSKVERMVRASTVEVV
ncbi:MAG: hypothetical protein ACT4PY_11360 [Armatimonadota bacterium]